MPLSVLQLDFRGYATPLAPGVLLVRANAAGTGFGDEGEAFLESRLSLVGETGFDLTGTIAFGGLTALRFRAVGLGVITEITAGLRTGAAICEIDSGSGALAGATGRITSNFVIGETGELTDRQVGLVFLDASREPALGGRRRDEVRQALPDHGGETRLRAHDEGRER